MKTMTKAALALALTLPLARPARAQERPPDHPDHQELRAMLRTARDAVNDLKCAVRCRASASLRRLAAVWILCQSALLGRDGREAAALAAGAAGLATKKATIAIAVSVRLCICCS